MNRDFIVMLDSYSFCNEKIESNARNRLIIRYCRVINALLKDYYFFPQDLDKEYLDWLLEYLLQIRKFLLKNRTFLLSVAPFVQTYGKNTVLYEPIAKFTEHHLTFAELRKFCSESLKESFRAGQIPSSLFEYTPVELISFLSAAVLSPKDNKEAILAAIDLIKSTESGLGQDDFDTLLGVGLLTIKENCETLVESITRDPYFKRLNLDLHKAYFCFVFSNIEYKNKQLILNKY
jgi:hypothetical protein